MPEPHAVLPMAVTQQSDTHACVGALTADGQWVRPEPVPLEQVRDRTGSPWRYNRWTAVDLGEPTVADPRPEDRELCAEPRPAEHWSAARCREWTDRYVDRGVHEALGGQRSLGMVYADLHRVFTRRATRGRVFLRFAFSDATGEEFDWIVPDVDTSGPLLARAEDGALPDDVARHARDSLLRNGPLLLTLGLTRPNNRFPGKFRGCHPLVVGVHPAPVAAVE
ncbi:MAG TPA: hypothetical protein VFV67_23065 [Actinophytocola sp.]|uniref:hypothetical protein n=1 Tax=Actinophytocola sp. TaxID=1872138 RepID=UPI002DB635AA|nr:hypothetical protein [Actinophytocola sp.]HEU5473537.1 hypothetical protein [Actinophytocola sp.]